MTPPQVIDETLVEVSLGEVSRNLGKLTTTVEAGFKDVAEKVEKRPTWSDVRNIETNLLERIRKLEANWRWISTTVGGSLVLAILGTFIYKS